MPIRMIFEILRSEEFRFGDSLEPNEVRLNLRKVTMSQPQFRLNGILKNSENFEKPNSSLRQPLRPPLIRYHIVSHLVCHPKISNGRATAAIFIIFGSGCLPRW